MTRSLISVCLLLFSPLAVQSQDVGIEITPDVVYGHKDGLAMTFDVFAPKSDANGAAVLFMVSGGWYSSWTPPQQAQFMFAPLVAKGYTVFAVRHGSSPRYGIPDAVADVRQSVRYIRANAERYHIDANRMGVFGMSAGGHLSLTLGTTGDDGMAEDKDPLRRVSDRVQAVVAYVAPTDLTIMVKDAKDRLPAYAQFPALNLDLANAKSLSPLLNVTRDDAPSLLLAGAKDDLVPVDHSRKIHDAFDQSKVANKLVEYPNAGHGFGPEESKLAVGEMIAWFDQHLAKK